MKNVGQCEPTRVESFFNIIRLLKVCATQKDVDKGSKLHVYVLEHKFLEKNVYIGSALVDMYAKCGALSRAQLVFEELPVRNVVTWGALIAGYVQQGQGEEALKCFDDMQHEGHASNAVTFSCALKACGNIGAVAKGEEIHDKVLRMGMLEKDIVLGATLVDMYMKCGALEKAQRAHKELPLRDAITWSALIAGYAQHGQGEEALQCFDHILYEGHAPSVVSFICALKACGHVKAVAKGKEIHDKIVSLGMLERDIILGNALVDMYVKCDALGKAQLVLKELHLRDAVTWSVLIAGYAQQGQGEEALKCLDYMLHEGHFPDAVTFVCALKACGSMGSIVKGEEIHNIIVSLDIHNKDILLGNALVNMYVKCGTLTNAQRVLEALPVRNVVSWNTLIAGYSQQGQGEEALKCFSDMLHEGHSPDMVTFICVLKAFESTATINKCEEILDKIVSLGILEKDIVLGNTLVDVYGKCGALSKAQRVLKGLPVRDVITWSSLIAGYALWGRGKEALKCFNDMLHEGHTPDIVTFICILKAWGSIGEADKVEEIHGRILCLGMLEKGIMLGTTLVDTYAKCGALAKAQQVLEELPVRNVVSWNALIAGYAQQRKGEDALKCFDDMLCEGHSPDVVTLIFVLMACGSIRAVTKGEEIHDYIVRLGMLEKDSVLGNSLMDMYVKCGAVGKAEQLLKEFPIQNVESWNAVIVGYTQQRQGVEALKCFDDMVVDGHSPDVVTFILVLNACGNIMAVTKGKEIHDKIVNLGLLEKDSVLGNALVDMYVQCGALAKAQQVLKELPVQDVLSWNALIGGYVWQGHGEEALECFNDMQSVGHLPDPVTFACVLKACGSIGATAKGEDIHEKIVCLGMLEKSAIVGGALVDMYAKCGALAKAQHVLEELHIQDVVTWSAIIAGYAQHGQSSEAMSCFERMLSKRVKPNSITMTSMLNACNHAGLLDQAEIYFSQMSIEYDIHPDLEHYWCMTDLFGRAGKFIKAISVIAQMPFDKCLPNWVALLGACRNWREVKIGRLAFERALHLDKCNAAVYGLMTDIYTAVGMQEEAGKIEIMRLGNTACKISDLVY